MFSIDPESPVPPYEQVRSQVARRAADGSLAPGTRLPTVRKTAEDLGLAVNTVARAYRELEADGVVVTHGRKGTFVSSAVLDGSTSRAAEAARAAAEQYVASARRLGLTREEALTLVDARWTEHH